MGRRLSDVPVNETESFCNPSTRDAAPRIGHESLVHKVSTFFERQADALPTRRVVQ